LLKDGRQVLPASGSRIPSGVRRIVAVTVVANRGQRGQSDVVVG